MLEKLPRLSVIINVVSKVERSGGERERNFVEKKRISEPKLVSVSA